MEEILKELKALREEKGVSLEDISKATRIPLDKLKALEEGILQDLPEPVFIIGYVEKYLRFLNIDPSGYVGRIKEALEREGTSIVPRHLQEVVPEKKFPKGLLLFIVLLLLALVLYFATRESTRTTVMRIVRVKKIGVLSKVKENEREAPQREASNRTSNKTAGEALKAVERKLPENATLEALGSCWVRFIDGDGKLKEFLLRRGDKISVKIPAILRAGNAQALVVHLGNNTYRDLGGKGEVINLLMDTSGLRKVSEVPDTLKKPFPR